MKEEEIKKAVREGYARIARREVLSCCSPRSSCCGGQDPATAVSSRAGYSQDEMQAVPEGANLGLGCGNPVALASLKAGEVVVDLGSGAGFDCFLAAARVGEKGRVIGVDMTPEMIEKARRNAAKGGYGNVEFRLGEIEQLPVADNAVDAVISNCVINLAPDKKRVFEEVFRVLKPGGRVMISDIVLLRPLPDVIVNSIAAHVGCLSGAVRKEDYLAIMGEAGFRDVRVLKETPFPVECMAGGPAARAVLENLGAPREEIATAVEGAVCSIHVRAVKP